MPHAFGKTRPTLSQRLVREGSALPIHNPIIGLAFSKDLKYDSINTSVSESTYNCGLNLSLKSNP